MMEQLTREQAIAFHDEGAWKQWNSQTIAKFQLEQDKLCVPFSVFQQAVSDTLGRPVFTHEFADRKSLIAQVKKATS
jgi:hypothetical protein